MQYQILKFFQSIQNPVLSFVANLLSFFGEETILIVIAIIFLYGIDKKKAFAFITSMVYAIIGTNILKAIFRKPRPFIVHKDLIPDRVETAGGYSFPSGHTTTATSFYISFAKTIGSKKLLIIAFLLSLLVGISRNYLLVHWPVDVLVGYILGSSVALLFTPYLLKKYDDDKWFNRFCLITGIPSLLFSIAITPLMTLSLIDTLAFSSLVDMTEIASGIYLGLYLERKYINFKECKDIKKTILNTIICLLAIGVIFLIASFFADKYIRHIIRYPLIGFVVCYLYPLFATKVGLLKK